MGDEAQRLAQSVYCVCLVVASRRTKYFVPPQEQEQKQEQKQEQVPILGGGSQSSAKTAETRHSNSLSRGRCRCEKSLGFRLTAMEALRVETG